MKLKTCDGCQKETVIWKNHEGFKYCKYCWSCQKAINSDSPQKPTDYKIPLVSSKRKKKDAEYSKLREKYLKQNDGSIDVTKFTLSGKGFCDDNFYIIRDREWGEYKKQSFLLSQRYDWEIKTDELGQLCLRKLFSLSA